VTFNTGAGAAGVRWTSDRSPKIWMKTARNVPR